MNLSTVWRMLPLVLSLSLVGGLHSATAQDGCSQPETEGWRCPDAFEIIPAAENPYVFSAGGYSGGTNATLQEYEGVHSAGYQYAVYYGNGNDTGQLRKPLIVVDGIDLGFGFGNGRSADEIFNTLLNRNGVQVGGQTVDVRLGDDVLQEGYDVVILDYGDALDFIQRNALALVHLIETINDELPAGEHIRAVVGPSLGAVVTRYALAYMEQLGIEHGAQLYVSFDGAHQGGHIPIGVQQLADDLVHHTDFNLYYGGFEDDADAVLRSPAVRQLLVFNAFAGSYPQNPGLDTFRRDPLRVQLFEDLADLGDYPSLLRKVAIVNGSPNGRSQLEGDGTSSRVTPGERLFDLEASITYGIGGFRTLMEAFAAPSAGAAGMVYRRRDYTCIPTFCINPDEGDWQESPFNVAPWTVSGISAYDSAPGGYRSTMRELSEPFQGAVTWEEAIELLGAESLGAFVEPVIYLALQALESGNVQLDISAPVYNHSFVHTVGALDYNTTGVSRAQLLSNLFDGQDLYRNILTDVGNGTALARTPFDGFYLAGDDGIEGRENQAHIALTPGIASYVIDELRQADQVVRTYTSSTVVAGDDLPAGATVVLGDDVTVTYTAAVTAGSGVQFELGRNANLFFEAPITFVGSASEPVRVERVEPSERWGRIYVRGDGSVLEHVVLDGGYRNVEVQARGVILRHITSRNGYRNLSTYKTASGARSDFTLENSTLEGATSVGAVIYFADATIRNTTIRTSGQAGLWVSNAAVTDLENSLIEQNGTTSTYRDGIEVHSSAAVHMYPHAYNTVRNNGGHEIYVSGSGRLYAGSSLCVGIPESCFPLGGFNTVSDAADAGGTDKHLYNGSSYAVNAEYNYWGTTSPSTSLFYGSVDYFPFLTSPASKANASLLAASEEALFRTLPPDPDVTDAASESALSREHSIRGWRRALRHAIRWVRQSMIERAAYADAGVAVAELYRLHGLDRNDVLGEAPVTRALLNQLARHSGKGGSGKGGTAFGFASAEARERAVLALVDDALNRGAYAEADGLYAELNDGVTSRAGRAEAAAARVAMLEGLGRYGEALDVLHGAGVTEEGGLLEANFVAVVEENLLGLLEAADATRAPADVVAEGNERREASLAAPSEVVELGAPYPNPTRDGATLELVLAEASHVSARVYDVLGRRVAGLAEGRLEHGRHGLHFDGSTLASGTYVVRVVVHAEGSDVRVLTRRLTLAE